MSELELERIHKKIKADFNRIKGKPILVRQLSGYIDDNLIEFDLERPAWFRVVETSENDLFHQSDREWIDPYWNLELIEPHPELAGVRSLWMFGTSYNRRTGEVARARYSEGQKEWKPPKRRT